MKIVWTDNFNRENIAERTAAADVTPHEGEIMVLALRAAGGECDWYKLVDDDYVLSRGIEDLI